MNPTEQTKFLETLFATMFAAVLFCIIKLAASLVELSIFVYRSIAAQFKENKDDRED